MVELRALFRGLQVEHRVVVGEFTLGVSSLLQLAVLVNKLLVGGHLLLQSDDLLLEESHLVSVSSSLHLGQLILQLLVLQFQSRNLIEIIFHLDLIELVVILANIVQELILLVDGLVHLSPILSVLQLHLSEFILQLSVSDLQVLNNSFLVGSLILINESVVLLTKHSVLVSQTDDLVIQLILSVFQVLDLGLKHLDLVLELHLQLLVDVLELTVFNKVGVLVALRLLVEGLGELRLVQKKLRVGLLKGRDLVDLQSVLLLLLADLVVELLGLAGVELLHVLDLLVEHLDLLDLLHVDLFLSAAVLGESLELGLVSAEELLLGLVEALHLELRVGDLLLELSVDLEQLLEFDAVVGLLLIEIVLFLLKLLDVGLHSLDNLEVRLLGLLRLKHVFSLAFLLLLVVELALILHLVLQIIDHVLELLDLVQVDSLGGLVLILKSDDLHLELLLGEHQLVLGSVELLNLSEHASLLGVPFLVQLVDVLGVGLLNLLDLIHEFVHLEDSLLSVRLLHGHSLLVELVDLLGVLHLLLRESLLIVSDLEVVLLLPVRDLRVELLDDNVVSLLHVGVSLFGEFNVDLLEVDGVLDFRLLELLLELNELLALLEVPSLLLLLLLDNGLNLEDVGLLHLLVLEQHLLLLLVLELDVLILLSVLVGQSRDGVLVSELNLLLYVGSLHVLLNLRVVLFVMITSLLLEELDLVQ